MKPIVLVVGTRAEALKLVPLYIKLKEENFFVYLCGTFQHAEMLRQVFDLFNVSPDFNLDIMVPNQDLFHVHVAALEKTKEVYQKINPALVIVHGDTTTTLCAAMAAFYMRIPIAHVEAGLRTGNMYSPFPEEMNRKVVGQIATYHFSPTALATANILAEGVSRENVFCTGNTIVDSLQFISRKILSKEVLVNSDLIFKVDECKRKNKKIILLTAHRRESFDGGLNRIFSAIKTFAENYQDVEIFYPSHPNPNVLKAIEESELKEISNISIMPPLIYKDLVYILMNCDFVATDSGGIQEEAVSLGKKVLCLRDVTERYEGVWEGSEILVGTNVEKILDGLQKFYQQDYYSSKPSSIYGDGNACTRIASILKSKLNLEIPNSLIRSGIVKLEKI
ncbi:TPA: UDP-N-acetylglucosamine 2-epimerase (non-hydrolyzing) [Candidatus Dependentiae bacterium]|nr:MAG: UDP-N-acetylglucosamine 2-epimerase [candidate division TM6 bacterium GW2011_GWE2_31_21]KKP54098.1 MAG: UDP-N-acetylglucosamine 2-epimerase [candidate division TM6 bacterium GW2011_GWF2_33_332]HBS48320.1 UDP-N-acetylglucosamine 2-epimerase (non-hydrolyzing) [Candidatus Dependentiae bacterium]HBZ73006.1 UDP-N-acetylglucosamine 2-epimerase (non-hydrolyzing) [Candidatus Dependentiae bacterium]